MDDIFEAVQIKALRDVHIGDDPEYILRRLYRWYSTTFFTPLEQVEDIPLVVLLQHYFESHYEMLSTDKRLKEIGKLFQDVDKLAKEKDNRDAEDEDFVKQLQKDIEREKAKKQAQDAQKKVAYERAKNQNIIQKLGNSPAAEALKRFMAEADSIGPMKKK